MRRNAQLAWRRDPAGTIEEQVEAALAKVRPGLLADGGDVQLVEIRDGVARVRLLGACCGCPYAAVTLEAGIEEWVRQDVPEIRSVEAVHAVA